MMISMQSIISSDNVSIQIRKRIQHFKANEDPGIDNPIFLNFTIGKKYYFLIKN
jgi:hypothetical protein